MDSATITTTSGKEYERTISVSVFRASKVVEFKELSSFGDEQIAGMDTSAPLHNNVDPFKQELRSTLKSVGISTKMRQVLNQTNKVPKTKITRIMTTFSLKFKLPLTDTGVPMCRSKLLLQFSSNFCSNIFATVTKG